MRTLAVCLLVAACNPNGLTIEVVISDPNIKKVELFAGDRCSTDCPHATVPPGLARMTVDDAFAISDPLPFTVSEAAFTDGVAGFRIESPQDTTLGILVVVGYDANDEIHWSWSRHWVDIPDADSERWRIELDSTTAITTIATPQPDGTERHRSWAAPNGLPSCLLLEHWSSGPVVTRDLLGPRTDLDCDSVAAIDECAPWIPNAIGAAPPIEAATCVLPVMRGGSNVCMLGGPQCSEMPTAPADLCGEIDEPYCTPQAMCQCSGPDQKACLRQQVMAITSDTSFGAPHVRCVIAVDEAGNHCSGSSFVFDAGPLLGTSARKCTGLRLNDLDTPLGTFETTLEIGMGKLELDSFSEPCKVDVSWRSGLAPLDNYAVLDVELDNDHHLALPMRIVLKPGCTNATSTCQAVVPAYTDTMFQCLAAPSPSNPCGPDPNGLCAGPMCETGCCGINEMCTPTGCKCGLGPRCSGTDTCEARFANQCGEVCCGPMTPCPF